MNAIQAAVSCEASRSITSSGPTTWNAQGAVSRPIAAWRTRRKIYASASRSRLGARGIISLMRIRAAGESDLAVMQDIERAAGGWFREIGMPEIAEDEPLSLEELARYRQDDRAWVAVDAGDVPVAYLVADVVDGCLHIEQVSVHPRAARRGIGGMLLEHAAACAVAGGIGALTLTTFAEVPWNAPYYARRGFRVLDDSELSAGMRAVRDREIAHGLHRWPRVCMRRDLGIPREAGS
jgi:GNAT superfamily N-acetyltransferase